MLSPANSSDTLTIRSSQSVQSVQSVTRSSLSTAGPIIVVWPLLVAPAQPRYLLYCTVHPSYLHPLHLVWTRLLFPYHFLKSSPPLLFLFILLFFSFLSLSFPFVILTGNVLFQVDVKKRNKIDNQHYNNNLERRDSSRTELWLPTSPLLGYRGWGLWQSDGINDSIHIHPYLR